MTQNIFLTYCKQNGLPEPTPEFRFHPKRKWRIDYYFEKDGRRVALEVEGAVWTQGRHTRGSGYIKDLEKYNMLAVQGIYLLRVQPKDLLKMETLNMVKQVLSC